MYSRKFPELRKFIMLIGDIAIIMLAYMLVMDIADIPVEADISNLHRDAEHQRPLQYRAQSLR